MDRRVKEMTEPFEFDAATRRFNIDLGVDYQIQITALNLADRAPYDEAPHLQMAGEVATNHHLGLALLEVANRLLNLPGSNLPES